jgi:TubC N-terminal docking domain
MGGGMTLSPSATELLTDLAEHGIEWKTDGDTIRYRPLHAMTALLLQRLRAHKAEVLAMAIIQEAHDLGNADLAEALAAAWGERISILTADGIPLSVADATALAQLRLIIRQKPPYT